MIDSALAFDSVESEVLAMGLTIQESAFSSLSDSAYLTVDFGEHDEFPVKIRISNHTAKPSYEQLSGYADFEVGHHDLAHGEWWEAMIWLAGLAEMEITPTVRDAAAKAAAENAAEALRKAEATLDNQKRAAVADARRQAAIDAALSAEADKITRLMTKVNDAAASAKARSRARYKLNVALRPYEKR